MKFLYLIFGICAIAVSIGKALAVNFGISKYLFKSLMKVITISKGCVIYSGNKLYFVISNCSVYFRNNCLQYI